MLPDSGFAEALYVASYDTRATGDSRSDLNGWVVSTSGLVTGESATRSSEECPADLLSISRSAGKTSCGPPSTINRRATRSSPTPTIENM
jgi:hypothetical protein